MSLLSLGIGEAVGNVAVGGGMAVQGAATVLSKLGDILLSHVNMMCSWAE